MNVTIKGKGSHNLGKSDFVASGGEGSVYRKGNLAFKIYTDQSRMMTLPKIQELSALSLPNIIRPQDVLYDSKNKPIGYTMRFVDDTYALCQLFTKAFRSRLNIQPATMTNLVGELRKIVSHVHSKDILIVDLNEMNFLVSDSFKEVFAIDCDSYQTKSYPATAIMESIRDQHSKTFSKGTDWFSFAIISFQMFIGIHPFKGKHSTYKTLQERMLNNISVLNTQVGIPAVCYPLTNIPQSYLDWYKAVFEEGKRLPPPDEMQAIVIIQRTTKIAGSNNFIIKKLQELIEDIVRFDPVTRLALTQSGIFSSSRQEDSFVGNSPALGLLPNGNVVSAQVEAGSVKLRNVSSGKPVGDFVGQAVLTYDGSMYVKNGSDMFLLQFSGNKDGSFMIIPKSVCKILENATKIFDGVVVQDLLGACYASFFNGKACYQLHIKELDSLRIVDAKYENRVFMALAFSGGKYDKYIFRLDEKFQTYDLRIEKDLGPVALNFVVLPKGVCAHLNEKEELELFSNAIGSASLKVIDDPALNGDMRLSRDGNQVLFARDNCLYSIELKKTP